MKPCLNEGKEILIGKDEKRSATKNLGIMIDSRDKSTKKGEAGEEKNVRNE